MTETQAEIEEKLIRIEKTILLNISRVEALYRIKGQKVPMDMGQIMVTLAVPTYIAEIVNKVCGYAVRKEHSQELVDYFFSKMMILGIIKYTDKHFPSKQSMVTFLKDEMDIDLEDWDDSRI